MKQKKKEKPLIEPKIHFLNNFNETKIFLPIVLVKLMDNYIT